MIRVLLLVSFALTLAAPARADTVRALLVGVGAYPHIPDADLRGPVNDVRLMAEVLIARGVAAGAITVLSTDPADLPVGVATGTPTRAAILGALDTLAREAAAGDIVVFHFSGHGSQAPDLDGDEMGGYDEILLPTDAQGWRGAVGMVENAIVDDEVQRKMQAILDTGARVVGILDACHSATGFRALGGAGVARTVAPATLGIPDDAPVAAAGTPNQPLRGEFVFLYAAQSDQRAFEYPLDDPQDARGWHGEFTRQIATVLRTAPQATWAQLLSQVSDEMRQGSATQTPDGEGPLLSAPVIGAVAGARRIAYSGGRLSGGLLWGLTEGSVVSLHATATDPTVVATARLSAVKASEATLIFDPDTTAPAFGYAELRAPAPPPPLRIAPLDDGPDADRWADLLAAAVAAGLADWSIATPDLVPVPQPGGVLAFAGRDGVLDPAGPASSPRLGPDAGAEGVAAFLVQAGHAIRLRRALASTAGAARGTARGAGSVSGAIGMTVERHAGTVQPDGGCAGATAAATMTPGDGVGHCDELWLTLINRSARAQDVTVLYLDRSFALTPIWPIGGLSNRIARGEAAQAGLRVEVPQGAALEEIIVIAVTAEAGDRRTDLSFLADPGAGLRDATPGLGASLAALLDDDATDRGFSPPALSPFTVLRHPVRVHAGPTPD